jgi:hypothetical protein
VLVSCEEGGDSSYGEHFNDQRCWWGVKEMEIAVTENISMMKGVDGV